MSPKDSFHYSGRRQQRRVRTLLCNPDNGFKTLAEGQRVEFEITNGAKALLLQT